MPAMLYRFKSEAGADVIMLAATAQLLLRLMGRDDSPQGIVNPEDLSTARARLEAGVAAEEAEIAALRVAALTAGEKPPRAEGVSLRQRAWPLRELLRAAEREGVAVVWGV